jgi:hypothetical protein
VDLRDRAADIPPIEIPDAWLQAVEADPNAGVELACRLAEAIKDSGAFAGDHIIPRVRYRETAARLEAMIDR